MELQTSDLYLVAYLHSKQIQPQQIKTEGQRRKKIVFLFRESPKLIQHFHLFQSGEATTNVCQFRQDYERVRDLMFSRLRA